MYCKKGSKHKDCLKRRNFKVIRYDRKFLSWSQIGYRVFHKIFTKFVSGVSVNLVEELLDISIKCLASSVIRSKHVPFEHLGLITDLLSPFKFSFSPVL